MNFKELTKQNYVFGHGAFALTLIDFEILGVIYDNGRNIIHEFINLPEYLEFARKYVGGYPSDDTNQFGKRNISKVCGFGPYFIDTLEFEDYRKTSVEDFENQCDEMISKYNSNAEIKLMEFMGNVKSAFKSVKVNSHEFYQLLPEEWKYNDISPFQLSSYLCGFSINRVDGILTVIQIDED